MGSGGIIEGTRDSADVWTVPVQLSLPLFIRQLSVSKMCNPPVIS